MTDDQTTTDPMAGRNADDIAEARRRLADRFGVSASHIYAGHWDGGSSMLAIFAEMDAERAQPADGLYAAIAHGDEEHRAWLREALDAFFAGKPVPAARGLGNKEARIIELEAALRNSRDTLKYAEKELRSHVLAGGGNGQTSVLLSIRRTIRSIGTLRIPRGRRNRAQHYG